MRIIVLLSLVCSVLAFEVDGSTTVASTSSFEEVPFEKSGIDCTLIPKLLCNNPTLKPFITEFCPETCCSDLSPICVKQLCNIPQLKDFAKNHCARTCGYCNPMSTDDAEPLLPERTYTCEDSPWIRIDCSKIDINKCYGNTPDAMLLSSACRKTCKLCHMEE